jgi:uncharacterized protein (UPF0333 family)
MLLFALVVLVVIVGAYVIRREMTDTTYARVHANLNR